MARNLTSAAVAQLTGTFVRLIFLVSLQFADQTYYVHTSRGSIAWSGQTWLGVGTLGKISGFAEDSEVNAQGVTLSLSAIDPTLLNESLHEFKTAGQAQVYFGFIDAAGALVADPIPLFIGLMDAPQFDISTETATVEIAVESRLSDMNRSRGGRYTDQDQRQRFPADGSLQWVCFLQDQHFNWK